MNGNALLAAVAVMCAQSSPSDWQQVPLAAIVLLVFAQFALQIFDRWRARNGPAAGASLKDLLDLQARLRELERLVDELRRSRE